jgi:hypothetical protein
MNNDWYTQTEIFAKSKNRSSPKYPGIPEKAASLVVWDAPKRPTRFSDVSRIRRGRCPRLFIYPCFSESLRIPIRLFKSSIRCFCRIAQRMYKVLIAHPLLNLTFRNPAVLYRGREQGYVVVPITEL